MRAGDFDVILVGGGLASALTALALLARTPPLRVALIERSTRLGGNHTWCFHAADMPADAAPLVAPLISARWEGYSVHFPRRTRRVATPYACITSARLHEEVCERFARAPSSALHLGVAARDVSPERVVLEDGRVFTAPLVVRATGPDVSGPSEERGYQKFVGLELAVEPGHPFHEPVMFDARIAQQDGFRFMYVLPLAPDRLLVEETFFSEGPSLDEACSTRAILAYAAAAGAIVHETLRSERGVLPMPWRDRTFDACARPLEAGYGGGLFHPVTGYSFPLAIRFALALAASDLRALESSPLASFAAKQAAQRPFLRLLTRLLFTCFAPERRFAVLEHFYRLPEPLIARFYAAELTATDRARIFLGAPPRGFSIGRALRLHTGAAP